MNRLMKEENACDESKMQSECDGARESALPPKFKDVRALADAYNALQAEFTRRCQRLKELEKNEENLRKGERETENEEKTASGDTLCRSAAETEDRDAAKAENRSQAAENEENKGEECPKSGACKGESDDAPCGKQTEKAVSLCESDAERTACGDVEMNIENETVKTSEGQGENKQQPRTAAEKQGATEETTVSESVRLKIIGEYLSSLKRGGAPLARGGEGTAATPPKKAASIEDAGKMALRFFKG